MNFIWRRSFKNPMTIWTFEGKFGYSHNEPSTYYYAGSKLKTDLIKALEKKLDLKVLMQEKAEFCWWAMTTLAPKTLG